MIDPFAPPSAQFKGVSEKLITIRFILTGISLTVFATAGIVLAILLTPWIWVAVGLAVIKHLWAAVLIRRQVKALQYATGEREFFLKQGIMFKNLQVIPYGRIQYVDLNEGPIERFFGLSTLKIHTASGNETSGIYVSGLPVADAIALREYLNQRGETEGVAR